MPNWCDNHVRIEHKNKTAIDRVVKAYEESRLCAEFIPIPEDLNPPESLRIGSFQKLSSEEFQTLQSEWRNKNQDKYGYASWYEFCMDNWGTKWDVGNDPSFGNTMDDRKPKSVTLNFQSAWSPPIGVFQKMTEEGYHVTADYYEPGMAYVGRYTSQDGDECYSIPSTADEVEKTIPKDMNELWNISEQMDMEEQELGNLMGGE